MRSAVKLLAGEYDYYCGVTSREMEAKARKKGAKALARWRLDDAAACAQFRSKLKALYWVLGEGEL